MIVNCYLSIKIDFCVSDKAILTFTKRSMLLENDSCSFLMSSIYFEGSSVGIAVLSKPQWGSHLDMRPGHKIFCSQIISATPEFDRPILLKILKSTEGDIISNEPKNPLLQLSLTESEASSNLVQFSESLSFDSISKALTEMHCQLQNQNQKSHQLHKFAYQDSPFKFNAVGVLIQHIIASQPRFLPVRENVYLFTDYLLNNVTVSQRELDFLDIFKVTFHPCMQKKQMKEIEDLSVFSVFQQKMSLKSSKTVLKRMFLNPTFNQKQLQRRYMIIEWMVKVLKLEGFHKKSQLSKVFRGISEMMPVVDAIKKNVQKKTQEGSHWARLMKTMEKILQLKGYLQLKVSQVKGRSPVPQIVLDLIEDEQNWKVFLALFSLLKNTLSAEKGQVSIRENQYPRLKELKEIYFSLSTILTELAKEQNFPFKDCCFIFMSQIGYLVRVTHMAKEEFGEQNTAAFLEKSKWNLKFSNSRGSFYSYSVTHMLDEKYGDLYGTIKDIEIKIFMELQSELEFCEAALYRIFDKISVISCFWGVSQLSLHMCMPKLSSQSLILSKSWHLLLGQEAVSNNCFSFPFSEAELNIPNRESNLVNSNYSNRVSVISGANGSGKTVYMKQVSLLIYLAHCGLWLPAEFAEIPLVDRLLMVGSQSSQFDNESQKQWVPDQPSCEISSYLCSQELKSLSKVFSQHRLVTNKSLIMIDEVGLGLDYFIALKLLYASIRSLSSPSIFSQNPILSSQNDIFKVPLSFTITHLTKLMTDKVLEENFLVRFLQMDVLDDCQYVFKIKPGLVKAGYGLRSAEDFLGQDLIQSAHRWWRTIKQEDI